MDCDYRQNDKLKWIKQSITNSYLNKIFNLSIIEWDEADTFALSNLVKVACDYKRNNPEMTTRDIGKLMNIHAKTIIEYLKQGTKLGWCNYNTKEESKRASSKAGKLNGRPLICVETGQIFESTRDCARQSEKIFEIKLNQSCISSVCSGTRKSTRGFHFKYVNDLNLNERIEYNV